MDEAREAPPRDVQAIATREAVPPCFPVGGCKLVVLSTCSFGLYELYWQYKHWAHARATLSSGIRPLLRAVFFIVWCQRLFQRIQVDASASGQRAPWHPGLLAALWGALFVARFLSTPFWFAGFLTPFVLLPVQRTADAVNAAVSPRHKGNSRITAWNVPLIGFGGMVVLMAVAGAFMSPVDETADESEVVASLYEQGQYEQAQPIAEAVLEQMEEQYGQDHPSVAQWLGWLAVLYESQGQYEEAERLYLRELGIAEQFPSLHGAYMGRILNNLSKVYAHQGRYDEAEPLHTRALTLTEQAAGPDDPEVATVLDNLASLYMNRGRFSEAEDLYSRAVSIREEAFGAQDVAVATSLNNLAISLKRQGRYAAAERLAERALGIVERALGTEHATVASVLGNLAGLYQDQGRLEDAMDLQKRSLAIAEKILGPSHPDAAITLNNIATLYWRLGRDEEAIPLAERALRIMENARGPDHPEVSTYLGNLAVFYTNRGQFSKAEHYHKRALRIGEEALGPSHPDVGNSLVNLATLYMDQGRYTEAEPLLDRGIAVTERALGREHPELATALEIHARFKVNTGRPREGVAMLLRALHIDERTIDRLFAAASERQKVALLAGIESRFDGLLELVLETFSGDRDIVRAAFGIVIRRKGQVLEALSQERRAVLESLGLTAGRLVERYQRVSAELTSLALSGGGLPRAGAYAKRLSELQSQMERLEEEMASMSAGFAASRQVRSTNVDTLVRVLRPGTALVEYVQTTSFDTVAQKWREDYMAFVLPHGEAVSPTVIGLGRAELINSSIRVYRQQIGRARQRIAQIGEAAAEEELSEQAEGIHRVVFAPVEEALGECRDVYVAPDGELNLIPLEVLRDDQDQYLVQTYQFHYVGSGRELARHGQQGKAAPGVAVLADPAYDSSVRQSPSGGAAVLAMASRDTRAASWSRLPGTRREARAVADLLGGEGVEMYLGGDASEEAFKALKPHRIIHMATHGFFLAQRDWPDWLQHHNATRGFFEGSGSPESVAPDFENPLLRSGLVLAGANQATEGTGREDGILSALEVSAQPLWGTDLVVLSACDTGMGEVRRGEGVFGLRRAFQLAGARTVVMSLWSVPDEETATLMSEFYRNLDHGKSRALRRAQLRMIQDRLKEHGAAHPLFWGAFVSAGEL